MKPARILAVTGVLYLFTGCQNQPKVSAPKSPPPATVENGGVKEGDLATVTLTEEAERRLGIAVAALETKPAPRVRIVSGEVVLPPGQSITVTAPAAGRVIAAGSLPGIGSRISASQTLFRLQPFAAPQRDLRSGAEAELQSAAARVEAARQRHERAGRMLRDQVGSVRAVEEAKQELDQAQAAEAAGRAKLDQIRKAPLDSDTAMNIVSPMAGTLRQVYVSDGQPASGGAPLFEVARLDSLWVRVPVYAGDLADVVAGAPARIGPLGAGGAASQARPVAAPPTGDALAATVDLYYEAPANLRLGEKARVELTLRGQQISAQVPYHALLYDIHGDTWVYERAAQHAFVRRRVTVRYVAGGVAILDRGPRPGTPVVTDGAAELFGTEFGAGK